MNNLNLIKEKILTDDNMANIVEYLMSKVILDKKLPQLKFFYKKHKIILGRNGLYSIYQPNGLKIVNHIHFQEVAKYIIDNIKNNSKINYIKYLENEMIRHKEKIIFFLHYQQQHNSEVMETKISAMYDYYYRYKNSLLETLAKNNLYR